MVCDFKLSLQYGSVCIRESVYKCWLVKFTLTFMFIDQSQGRQERPGNQGVREDQRHHGVRGDRGHQGYQGVKGD